MLQSTTRAISAASIRLGLAVLLAGASGSLLGQSCPSLTALDTAATQNFDSFGIVAGAWTDNVSVVGAYSTQTTFLVGTGTSTSGALYSFGASAAADRAMGSVASGSAQPINALCFVNNTGSALTSADVAYVGEQWRNGGNASAQSLTFEYQVAAAGAITDANVPSTGWIAQTALDFTSPVVSATAAALDGNMAANRIALALNLPVAVPVGQELWLRWKDINDSGNDHGLAVDDFSLIPRGIPPTGLRVGDVTLIEGNSGTTSFDFAVSLDDPAPLGGVTFDITTINGTATAPSDYTAKTLTGVFIPSGSQNITFSVLVNGDTTFENDETFKVKVSNVVGVAVVDGEGLGTITNDDTGAFLSISDATNNEGNGGTTPFQFTVSLTQAAPAGGVSFDIATSDGTATSPSDYTSNGQLGVVIPAGQTFTNFTVLVNGDTTPEADETFNVTVSNVGNALLFDGAAVGTILNDDLVKIHDVQGATAATPIAPGMVVAVEGVVTASFQGANQLSGFFLQEEDADIDADPLTSEGVFVYCLTCPVTVAEGQRVRISGTASEFFGMTQINATSVGSVTISDAGNRLAEITPATIVLPVVGSIDDYYEPREGMLVRYTDALSVSEYFELPRYGTVELYQGGRPRQFTEIMAPSAPGYVAHLGALAARRVIIDDENNSQNSLLTLAEGTQFAYYPRQNGGLSVGQQGTDFFRGGDVVNNLTGVLHWSFAGLTGTDAWRIRPTSATPPVFTTTNPRPVMPPDVGGAIRAVGMNLLNYFTTIDTTSSSTTGPCGPDHTQDCRGADSTAELDRQRNRTVTVLCGLKPDVAGLMELENTTASDTITDLLLAVNAQCGAPHPYAIANTGGTLGGDAIRVQIIYRTGVVAPFGAPMVDLDPINNRPTTAQVFDVVDTNNGAYGERFTLVANHLKSKGCSGATGGDADINDGQGCFSARRTSQANRLLTWLNSTVIPVAGDSDVLLVGDFNSYAQEPPITTLTGAGYTDLETALLGSAAYSYLFDGQLGHLDYALASSSLNTKVKGVAAWHINADESALFDYNDNIRDVGEAANEEKPDGSLLTPMRSLWQQDASYRASDHDPVLVGLFDTDRIFQNGFDSTP